MRLEMVIELKRCSGCYGCQLSCKADNGIPPGVFFARVLKREEGKYPSVQQTFLPVLCNQCTEHNRYFGDAGPTRYEVARSERHDTADDHGSHRSDIVGRRLPHEVVHLQARVYVPLWHQRYRHDKHIKAA